MKRYYLGIINFFRIGYHWLISCLVIIAIVGFIILQLFRPEASESSYRYILSAISQSIAALFALIFTISFIILQVAFRFKGILEEFLSDVFNIIYPALCGLAILVPFIVLRFDYYAFWIDISISIASLCVFLVVPFFLRSKDFLKYNVGIREDLKIARGLIGQNDVEGYKNYLWVILGLSNSARDQKNYSVIKIVMQELLSLSKYIYRTNELAIDAVKETIIQFSVHLQIANRENVLGDVSYVVVEAARIPSIIPDLEYATLTVLSEALIDTAEKARNVTLRKQACCSVWALCARWRSSRPGDEDKIELVVKNLVMRVGLAFALECNNPQGPRAIYENAAWQLKLRSEDADAYRMLEVLRSTVISDT